MPARIGKALALVITPDRFSVWLRRARRLPRRTLLSEFAYRIGRAVCLTLWRMRDAVCPTYSCTVSLETDLRAHATALDPQRIADLAPSLADRCARYLSQNFDVLGSGWRTVIHGAACDGFDGYRYQASLVRTDACGVWLAGQVPRPNLARARAIWVLLDPGHRPIDWHLDFRSGYRWSPLSWYRAVPFGHLPGVDVKIPWELARMQHLPQMALAFGCARAGVARFLPSERYRDGFRNQVLDFVATNPPRYGVNWCSTMDVAIRVANLLLAYDLFRANGAEFDRDFESVFVRSIRDHGWHIARNLDRSPARRNNHYLADLAGLIFVASYLSPTRETRRWSRFAEAELGREIRRQFHPDGSHFEGSTSYHALAVELVSYAVAITSAGRRRAGLADAPSARNALPPAMREAFGRMAEFLIDMTQPNGRIVQIGDHDSGRLFKLQPLPRIKPDARPATGTQAPALDEEHLCAGPALAALSGLLDRSDILNWCAGRWLDELLVAGLAGAAAQQAPAVTTAQTRAERVAIDLGPRFASLSRRLRTKPAAESSRVELVAQGASLLTRLRALAYPDFGAYVFRSDRLFLCVRAGAAIREGTGGHAHVDQLSLEVCVDGLGWIRDPGSYAYTPSPHQRNTYRSSAAHFVPYELDGEAELWSCGIFNLALEVRVRDIALDAAGLAIDLELAGNRLGQLVTIGEREIVVETWIFRRSASGRLRAHIRPGHAGRYLLRGEALGGAVAFSPGYGLKDDGKDRVA